MKIWTSEHVFNHPWETVAQAAWRKYPNPINPAVFGTDVLDRRVDKNGILHTHRIISSRWGLPSWAKKILGDPSTCYASEHSKVDVQGRTFRLETQNLTFGSYIAVDECLVYEPHPENPDQTLLRQEACIKVAGVPLTSYMENILSNMISSNAGKGRAAMEWVICKVKEEARELDELFFSTRRSIGDLTHSAWRSMDDLSHAAKISLDSATHQQPNSSV